MLCAEADAGGSAGIPIAGLVRCFRSAHGRLIPRAVLSERLGGLVADGILERRADPDHAGRHLYELTPAGRDLWPVVHALLVWGRRHRHPSSRVFKHVVCGTPLDDSGACPTCRVIPDADAIVSELQGQGRRDDPVALALRAPHQLLEPIET